MPEIWRTIRREKLEHGIVVEIIIDDYSITAETAGEIAVILEQIDQEDKIDG